MFTARSLRPISGTTLFFFLWMTLYPAVSAAVGQGQATPPAAQAAQPSEPDTLDSLRELAGRAHAKADRGEDESDEANQLLKQADKLDTEEQQAEAEFAQTRKHLEDHHLPDEIKQRHAEALAGYRAKMKQLKQLAQGFKAAHGRKDKAAARQQLKEMADFLGKEQKHRRHQPFDPNNLPNATLKPKPGNVPKETDKAFIQAGLTDTPALQLAALGDFTFDKVAEASNPAYLAATDEVVLSQAIKDRAQALNYDPVKIYHWVRNHVEWQPTWGGIQAADLTLSSLRGNAMDIAGLTIALLRASKIPARYAHGTIDVPVEAFKNWAGGFSDSNAAMAFAASGGIPVTAVTSGGKISKVRLEHVWVEAAIDFIPSRGAKNKDADSWVEMDPSYKQYDYKKGLDAIAISGIDPQQLAQSFVASGTVNDAESWATGFDPTILANAQTQARQKLETYIKDNLTNPTVGDVIGGRKTIIEDYPLLPAGLPNTVLLTGKRYDKLPAALQQQLRYGFGTDIEGNLLNPISLPFAKANNQKLTLSFTPATAADEQVLQSLLPQGEITDISQLPKSIPSYLVSVIPELKLNGETVKAGSPMRLGEELPWVTAVSFAGRGLIQAPRTYYVIAGSYLAVNAYAGSVSPQMLNDTKAKLEHTKTVLESADQTQIAALGREDLLGDLFHAGGLGYYAQLTALSHLLGLQADAHYTLAAGIGTFGYEPKVSYFFGFPRSIQPGGIALDIPLIQVTASNDGDAAKKKQYTLQTGILSSALEHAVPEQLFTNAQNPGEAISAVKAIQKASAAGQRIYHITQANQSAILGNIHHDSDTMTDIRNALNAGKEVITHTDKVSVPGWTGAGYIITDADTGAGAFKIAGGGNGSFLLGVSVGLILTGLLITAVTTGTIFLIASVLAAIGINGAFLSLLDLSFTNDNLDLWCFASGLLIGLSFIGLFYTVSQAAIWGAIMTALGISAGFSPNFVGPLTCLGAI